MDRRDLLLKIAGALALGPLLLGACRRRGDLPRSGSGEKLWELASGKAPPNEPPVAAWAKDTPAFFRDASQGKADASFVPKVSGG